MDECRAFASNSFSLALSDFSWAFVLDFALALAFFASISLSESVSSDSVIGGNAANTLMSGATGKWNVNVTRATQILQHNSQLASWSLEWKELAFEVYRGTSFAGAFLS